MFGPRRHRLSTLNHDSMSASLNSVLNPSTVAVIGASRREGTIGHTIVANLLRHGFQGTVYPVNPHAKAVHSVRAYPTIGEVPESVDLAVLVVPKEHVLGVAQQCGEANVGALVVISAGFKEVGGAGHRLEQELVTCAAGFGMRLVGPNCMGVLNTRSDVSMNATFAPSMPPAGGTSFMSQSGAIGVTILDYAAELGIGIHNFVSVGNKADVSGNDLLEFWEDDPETRSILMYLEGFGHPERFTTIARRVSRKKPIIVVKSGRTRAGAAAASSHTGALAGTEVATEELLAQCGVLRADSIEDLFDFAMAFEGLPIPQGNRVAIITNAGGPGIMIADACEAAGLEVAPLSAETQKRLAAAFPAEASVRNPVDMIASATPESYQVALDTVLEDPAIDGAIAAFVPPLGIRQQDVAQSILAAAERHTTKPVLAVLMGREGLRQGRADLREAGIPTYMFPESAGKALAAMVRYGQWLARPVEAPHEFDVDRDHVTSVLDKAEREGRDRLLEPEALSVLNAYRIPVVEYRVVRSPSEATEAAEALGFPLVAKVISSKIVHKSDIGAVRINIRSHEELEEAIETLHSNVHQHAPGVEMEGVVLAQYLTGGRETIVGIGTDPTFGQVLMFGLGGIHVETLADVAFRILPVTRQDAADMITSLRGHALFEGLRGESASDVATAEETIQKLSQLAKDHPRIAELDVNPFLLFEKGGAAVDARIALRATPST